MGTTGQDPGNPPAAPTAPRGPARALRRWLGTRFAAPPSAGLATQLGEERPRYVNWLPVLFGFGIWACFALGVEPSGPLVIGLVLAGVSRADGHLRLAALALIIAGAGFATAKVRTEHVAAPVLERTLHSVRFSTTQFPEDRQRRCAPQS